MERIGLYITLLGGVAAVGMTIAGAPNSDMSHCPTPSARSVETLLAPCVAISVGDMNDYPSIPEVVPVHAPDRLKKEPAIARSPLDMDATGSIRSR
jgi:hypothetical protein